MGIDPPERVQPQRRRMFEWYSPRIHGIITVITYITVRNDHAQAHRHL
jgi:hypothetical protein